jgi:hypothetical protein
MAEKKLLDQVRDVIRTRHYSYKTEKSYVYWILNLSFSTKNAIPWIWGRLKLPPS